MKCCTRAGIAGAVSRTATAPVDRVKLLLQVQDVGPALTIRDGFHRMAAEGARFPAPRSPISCTAPAAPSCHSDQLTSWCWDAHPPGTQVCVELMCSSQRVPRAS
jgi:hypothetical protein